MYPPRPRFRAILIYGGFIAGALISSASFAASPFKVEEATIASIHKAILAKELTCSELVGLYLKRIHAFNGPGVEEPEGILGPIKTIPHAKGINALGTLNLRPANREKWGFDARKARSMTDAADNDAAMPDALEIAAKLDRDFAKTGKLSGPLHCVTISIKDQYDTFDMRTTSGADADYANDRPPKDATFVKRLREAGAIILAKANMGEYASGFRSAFGGTSVNPYDTERVPAGSSGGSATSAAANFVTVSIGEESGPSIRGPAQYANTVGISPTQELVSRIGLFNRGLNTRTGPITRTVEDAAKVLTIIAGYDPEDELTAFALDRMPDEPYENHLGNKSLKGIRIGVVREYMDKKVFDSPLYASNIAIAEKAIEDLRKLGATIIEPPEEGLFTAYIRRYNPSLQNTTWTKLFPELFPVDAAGAAKEDQVNKLVAMRMDPNKMPESITLRDLGAAAITGENKYGFNLYLTERGDAKIKTIDDLINHSRFFNDIFEGDKKATLMRNNEARVYDNTLRLQKRFAVQQIVLQAMAEMELDAVVYPTGLIPPRKINTPRDPNFNGISNYGMWNYLGVQGFPAITVPAGFTKEVWDRIADPKIPLPKTLAPDQTIPTILVGPVKAKLPVGIDFLGRPFSEPMLLRIAYAYEAGTKHRQQPVDFGPLK
ncbi:MAG: amidase [Cellvibrionaceae bacterium]|nr:amidase [Cellvibrionaceae bacterium]